MQPKAHPPKKLNPFQLLRKENLQNAVLFFRVKMAEQLQVSSGGKLIIWHEKRLTDLQSDLLELKPRWQGRNTQLSSWSEFFLNWNYFGRGLVWRLITKLARSEQRFPFWRSIKGSSLLELPFIVLTYYNVDHFSINWFPKKKETHVNEKSQQL